MGSKQWVQLYAERKRETPKAYLLSNGRIDAWVPKSQIKLLDGNMVSMPDWLACKSGFK